MEYKLYCIENYLNYSVWPIQVIRFIVQQYLPVIALSMSILLVHSIWMRFGRSDHKFHKVIGSVWQPKDICNRLAPYVCIFSHINVRAPACLNILISISDPSKSMLTRLTALMWFFTCFRWCIDNRVHGSLDLVIYFPFLHFVLW